MYSIDDLKTFVAIAETGGVTAGARRGGVSPATATHRVKKLETALNLTLFHRSNRAMRLTGEGQVFFERVQVILSDLALAERDAGSGTAQLTGTLRVTMSPWILSRFVMPALPAFQAAHPGLTLDFLAVDRFVSLAAEGQDCAIRVGKLIDSALVAAKLCDNDRVICAAPELLNRAGHPATIAEVLVQPWVCLPWQTRIAFAEQGSRKHEATVSSRVLVSNSDMLTEAAVSGLGFAVKSRLAIEAELTEGRLIEVLPGALWQPEAPISLVYAPEARYGQKAQIFGQLARQVFARRNR